MNRISAQTEIVQPPTATSPVNKFIYLDGSPPPFEADVLASLRARVAADCAAERNRKPKPSERPGKPRPDAPRRGRRSTQRNNSSPNPSNPKSNNDSKTGAAGNSSANRARSFNMRTGHRGLVKDHHKALALCGLGTYGEKHERKPQAHSRVRPR